MPRTESKLTVNNFVGGLVTDFHELNTPQNVTVDEDNCDLDRKGSRKRRLGIDFEDGYTVSSASWDSSDFDGKYLATYTWEAVLNDGNRNFLIVQIGSTLYFYDLAFNPVSSGILPFTVNLTTYKMNSSTTTEEVSSKGIDVTSGKGALFVCGEVITPFYVEYDPSANNITVTAIDILIRDFELQSKKSDYEDEPTTIDYTLNYDYFNQGWYYNKIATYDGRHWSSMLQAFWHFRSKYPSLSKQWVLGKSVHKDDTFETFDPGATYNAVYVGNLLAPLGHYIIDPFNIDRSGLSGIAGFSIVRADDRPTAIAFYSGKVFYGWKNQIFFSQTLINDLGVSGKCYQSADPTAQDINNLVATDGGVIPLQHSGQILKMVPYENSLLVFCTNGVWAIGGASIGSGFSADGFSLYKISGVGAISSRSVLDVEGDPVYWAKTGIFTVTSVPAKQAFDVVNICKDKVQLFYDALPGLSKLYATGAYDKRRKIITWIYNSGDTAIDGNPYFCNRCLNYDTLLHAFFPYTLSDLSALTPRIADVFSLFDVATETITENVTVSDVLVTVSGETVTIDETILGNFDNQNNIGIKFLTLTKEVV